MICLSDISLIMDNVFPRLIVLTSTQESSAAPMPRIFDVALHTTKPSTFVYGK